MKKTISLILIIFLTFSFTACSEKDEDTVFVEWMGATIDLSKISRVISPTVMMGDQHLSDIVKSLTGKQRDFVIVRAECTGNWIQKNYDTEAHFKYHVPDNYYDLDTFFYIEIPFKITDVLEGNQSIVEQGDDIHVEIKELEVFAPSKEPNSHPHQFEMLYGGATNHFVYPRIGYEYVLVLEYCQETDCIVLYSGGGIICELTTPKEYFEFQKSLRNNKGLPSKDVDYDKYIAPMYYETIERYNIKVD